MPNARAGGGWRAARPRTHHAAETLEEDSSARPDREHVRDQLRQLDAHVAKLHAGLPSRTLLVVFSGHGDMLEARREMARQDRRRKSPGGAQLWTESDQTSLEHHVSEGRRGVCFVAVKL